MVDSISGEVLLALSLFDTCSIANAIETFGLRLHNEGFTNADIRSFTPQLPPMVGYAETLRVRSSTPPPEKHVYFDRTDWWLKIVHDPGPRVLVIQDVDSHVGVGAFIGSIHSEIFKAMGCVGAITNGAVRDVPDVAKNGFHLFAGNVSPSHAYIHVIEYGEPVEVAGLRIRPGDLLHGDQHGVVNIPREIAEKIPDTATHLKERETRILNFCRSDQFTVNELREIIASPNK